MPNDRKEVAKSMISMVDVLDRSVDRLRNVGSDGLSIVDVYMLLIAAINNSGTQQIIVAGIDEIPWLPRSSPL